MEDIKIWAFSICSAAICGAVLNMILPEGSTQKIYKTVFSIFFLCILVSPVLKFDFENIDITEYKIYDTQHYDISENEFSETYTKTIEQAIYSDVSNILEEYNIYPKDISVKINIFDDGSIDINKFTLTLDQNISLAEIKNRIKEKTGIEPEIIVSEEN